ncbi:tautomerase family protein [Streptomyces sp. NPDC006422]|uniref:tautomerase family protein n=1 Tax=unclassified Streptomyces TaxID=2593676 RepID=UPI0033BFB77B
MPFIRVTINEPDLAADTTRRIADGLTELAVSALNKSPARTTVHLSLVPAALVYIAGAPVTGTGATAAHVEASITAGTTSAAEKEAFIKGAYELLKETLGALPSVAGVALHELHPESYGYNGITQLEHYRTS